MALQALLVECDESITMDRLEYECGERSQLAPAEGVSGDDATKDNVVEPVASGSASLVRFLAHATPPSRADRHRRKKSRKRERERERKKTSRAGSLFCYLLESLYT